MTNFADNGDGRPSKSVVTVWPPNSTGASWARLEPLLTVDQLQTFHLFGIPLVSREPDPLTGQRQVITREQLPLFVERAVSIAEAEVGITIMPDTLDIPHEFDRPAFEQYGYIQIPRRPVWAIHSLSIRSPNDSDPPFFTVPNEWITSTQLWRGKINIVPINLAFAGTAISPGPATGTAGAAFLASIGSYWFVPTYWRISCTVGFPQGKVPVIVNELVGCIAAMEILSMLAATHARVTSASTGIDGLSQSQGFSGPNIYGVRLGELKEKRAKLVNQLKTRFGAGRFSFGVL